MVRYASRAALLLCLVSPTMGIGPARAQAVDWSAASGGLFGFSSEDREGVGEFEALSDRIAALSQPYQAAVEAAARRHGLDEKLLHAVVIVESAYRPEACLIAGACGLTQLMPGTAADLQVPNRLEPEENVRGGVAYLAQQLVRFGDVRLALAAYNAGPARVARLGQIPDIAETRQYVASVLGCYLRPDGGPADPHRPAMPAYGRLPMVTEPAFSAVEEGALLTRAETSAFLAQRGIRLKPAPLAQLWSTRSDGPPCLHVRSKPFYPRNLLEAWAAAQILGLRTGAPAAAQSRCRV